MLRVFSKQILYHKYLLLIVFFAVAVRVVGIFHTYPFVFHPDEPTVVNSALALRFNSNPGHFDWPHLYFYLNYFLYMFFAKLRTVLQLPPVFYDEPIIFYLLSRTLSAFLGGLTSLVMYFIGKSLAPFLNMPEISVGLLAALIFALFPYHQWHSHYALIDVPMTFFLSLAVYFSVRNVSHLAVKNYFFAGVFFGLAASTKYNALLYVGILPLVTFYVRRLNHPLVTLKELSLSALACIGAFLLTTPYALLDLATFIRTDGPKGALWQFTNVGKVAFVQQLGQFYDLLVFKLPEDISLSFVVLYLLSGFYFCYNFLRKKQLEPLLILLFVYSFLMFFYVAGFERVRSHYLIPNYVLVTIFIISAITVLKSYLATSLYRLVIVLVFALPIISVGYNVVTLVRPDTRNVAYSFLKDSVTADDVVLYEADELDAIIKSLDKGTVKKSFALEDTFEKKIYMVIVESEIGRVKLLPGAFEVQSITPLYQTGPVIIIYAVNK